MHGPLSEIGVAEVLQLLERGERNGILRIVGPDRDSPRTLTLHRGRLVAVHPDASAEAIDRALVRRQLVPASTDTGGPREHPLRDQVGEELARRTLDRVMHWEVGRFDFDESTTGPGTFVLTSDSLLLDLVSGEGQRAELAALLDDWHAVPAMAAASEISEGEQLVLDTLEWRILDVVDGVRDVAGIAALLDERLEEVGARVRRLSAAAILHLHRTDAAPVDELTEAGRADRYDDTALQLRTRVSRSPDDPVAWRELGLAEVGAGRFERAIEAWRSWREAEPQRAADADALIQAATTMMEALRDSSD